MLHILSKFQTQRLDGELAINPNPKLTAHETHKQGALDALSDKLTAERLDDQSLKECFELLTSGILGKKGHPDPDNTKILSLFKNNYSWNDLGARKCPRSAALALVAFTLKVFGDKIVNNGAIYRKDLEFGMNMLFGKNMVDIEQDVFDMVDSIRIEKEADGSYTLASKNYRINVSACIPPTVQSPGKDGRLPFFKSFVNAENIRSSFFHNIDKATVHAFFGGVDNTPKDIEACCEKSKAFQSSSKPFTTWLTDRISMRGIYLKQQEQLRHQTETQPAECQSLKKQNFTKENTIEKSYLHAQGMEAGSEPMSAVIESNGEKNSFRMYYPVSCAPANTNKKEYAERIAEESDRFGDKTKVDPESAIEESVLPSDLSFMPTDATFVDAVAGLPPSTSTTVPASDGVSRMSAGQKAQALSELPVNSYRVEFGKEKANGDKESSEVNLIASQVGRTPEQNRAGAREVIRSMIQDEMAKTGKKYFRLIDIRLMIENNKKVLFGSERQVYLEHTTAMRLAAQDVSEELDVRIDYRPIFQQANSRAEGVGLAINSALGRASYPMTGHPDDPVIDDLSADLSKISDKEIFKKSYNLFARWQFLFEQRGKSDNSVPLVTTSKLLVDYLNKNSQSSEPHNLLGTACYSAKDRTMAVVLAMWMIFPLMRDEMDKEAGDIRRFFHTDGTFNYHALSVEEKLQFQKHFNLNMLHIQNLLQNGKDTNISVDLFKNLFPGVSFIQEADFTPVNTKL